VANTVPPVGELYQLIVPEFAEALRSITPASHLDPGLVATINGEAFTVAKTGILSDVQVAFAAST